jgi:hypothetical protein
MAFLSLFLILKLNYVMVTLSKETLSVACNKRNIKNKPCSGNVILLYVGTYATVMIIMHHHY